MNRLLNLICSAKKFTLQLVAQRVNGGVMQHTDMIRAFPGLRILPKITFT